MGLFYILFLFLHLFIYGGFGDSPTLEYNLGTPLNYPLHINVVFMGLKGDGPFQYHLQDSKVAEGIQKALSLHTPFSFQSKSPLNINYTITYAVSVSPDIQKYESYLRNALTKRGSEEETTYTADIASVETFFENRIPSNHIGTYTIFFVHPNKEQLVGRFTEIDYSYSLNGWGNSQSWIGSGRYLVIDMTAGPVRYGKVTDYSEGVVDYESFPRIIEFYLPDGYQGTTLQGASPIEIEAKLVSLIISAVKYLFAADIHTEQVSHAEKLLVPIIVLRNHNEFNPYEEGINMENVRHEINKMALPGQTIQIISANHYVHEHSHISIALSKSLKTDTEVLFNNLGQYRPHYRPYIDSKLFAHQLREVSDILGQGLLGNNINTFSGDLKSIFFNENLPPHKGSVGTKRSLGTRVLPVYVISLTKFDSKLLLDKYYQVAAYNDLVIVLQTSSTSAPVPFFMDNSPLLVDPKSTTKSIIAGLATSLGSITPPNKRYSQIHQKEIEEYLWAQGQHPFGHFTNSTKLSQIFVDAVTRNTILAKVHNSVNYLKDAVSAVDKFAKSYFLDPLDATRQQEQQIKVVSRITSGATDFNSQFIHINSLLLQNRIKDALTHSHSLEIGTSKFYDYTLKEIEMAENDLICCLVSHQFQTPKVDYTLWSCMIAALIFIAVLCYRVVRKQFTK